MAACQPVRVRVSACGGDEKQTTEMLSYEMGLGVNASNERFVFERGPCVSGCRSGSAAWLHITVKYKRSAGFRSNSLSAHHKVS